MLEQVTVEQFADQTDLLEFRLRMSQIAQSEIFRLHVQRRTASESQSTFITSAITALEEHTFEEASRLTAPAHFAYGTELAETYLAARDITDEAEMADVLREIHHACLITKLGFNSRMRTSGVGLHVPYECSLTISSLELVH